MAYNSLSAEAQGKFTFHKQSKYKRQSTPVSDEEAYIATSNVTHYSVMLLLGYVYVLGHA